MGIVQYTGKQKVLRFRTYDLEWYPESLEVRIVGEYGSDAGLEGYESYDSVPSFLRAALSHENSGMTWFAHAGGLYDVQFLLEYLAYDPRYRLTAAFSGSSVIILKVSEANGKNTWTFCDSFWLIRESLANLAPMTGREKGGKEYRCAGSVEADDGSLSCGHKPGKCIFWAPIPILREYNALDCQILYEAIAVLQDTLLALGGALKKTIASCALHLFRSRFLTREIETSAKVNELARNAYIASRVEVYRPSCASANYYDINSSFPASMTSPQPGKVTGFGRTIPDGLDALFMAHCTVRVPDMYLPPLPRRSGGKVVFPVGQWEGWFFHHDIRLLENTGGRVLSVKQVVQFEPVVEDFARYVDVLYGLKKGAQDSATRQIAKYLLNAHYGKYAENPIKQSLVVRPKKTSCPHGGAHTVKEVVDGVPTTYSTCMRLITPGVWAVEEEADIPHEWVPISANITAESRARQYANIAAGHRGGNLYYGDTDSTLTDAVLQTGSELGELKLEHTIESGEFLAPKLYRLRVNDAGKRDTLIKAKGFHALDDSQFDALKAGGSLEYDHFCRVRERLTREHLFGPKQEPREKRLLKARPKRCWTPDGNTRPWTVREEQEL
jgi:hypothetical protein